MIPSVHQSTGFPCPYYIQSFLLHFVFFYLCSIGSQGLDIQACHIKCTFFLQRPLQTRNLSILKTRPLQLINFLVLNPFFFLINPLLFKKKKIIITCKLFPYYAGIQKSRLSKQRIN